MDPGIKAFTFFFRNCLLLTAYSFGLGATAALTIRLGPNASLATLLQSQALP